jgi:hypothetical protein
VAIDRITASTDVLPRTVRFSLGPLDRLFANTTNWRIAIAAVLTLQLALIFTHRPWLDEWQALQIALQSPTLSDLFENLRYEGHPPLWYFILRGTALVVPAFWVLPVVAAVIAFTTQITLLTRSPFSRSQRLLIACGVFMMFEYLTISRSMSLGVCLAVLATALRTSRWRWLAIAMLPQCDFLFGVISICLIVLSWRDRTLWLPGLLLWAATSAFAAWSIRPAPDMIPALWLSGIAIDALQYLVRLGVLLVPVQTVGNSLQWNGVLPFNLGLVCGPLFIWFALKQVRDDGLHLLLIAGLFALTFVFSISVYPLHTRHLTLITLMLILMKWRSLSDGEATNPLFDIWLVIGAVAGILISAYNFVVPFDTAHRAARYIEGQSLMTKHWLVFPDSRAQGVSALTGIAFERLERGCGQTFIRWDYRTNIDDWKTLERAFRMHTKMHGRAYVLSDVPFTGLPKSVAKQITYIPPGYNGQAYYISVIGPSNAEMKVSIPLCVPRQQPL